MLQAELHRAARVEQEMAPLLGASIPPSALPLQFVLTTKVELSFRGDYMANGISQDGINPGWFDLPPGTYRVRVIKGVAEGTVGPIPATRETRIQLKAGDKCVRHHLGV